MIEDGTSTGVQPAERDGSEVDGPDVVSDLLETDVLSGEQMGDEDALAGPADAGVGGDLTDLEVGWVLGRLELGRERTGRRPIDGGRGSLSVGFVRSDLVEVGAESVEPALLSCARRGRRDGGLSLEILMHAFVAF